MGYLTVKDGVATKFEPLEMNYPQFVHDCDACIFLGRWRDWHQQNFDLYYCPGDGPEGTVLARWSDHGPDYHSGLLFADSVTPLGMAAHRAQLLYLIRRLPNDECGRPQFKRTQRTKRTHEKSNPKVAG